MSQPGGPTASVHDHDHDHADAHVDPHAEDHTDAHDHDHADAHDHDHVDAHVDPHAEDHTDAHDHDHGPRNPLERLLDAIPFFHSHSHGEVNIDNALETNERGIWALKVSLLILGATALFQLFIVFISGSVALLADTLHNLGDALTAVPLWIAFVLGRRPPNRRYTYGYGRAEDIAGVVIVAVILISAAIAGYEAWRKLVNPQPLENVTWVIVAAIVGFIGNEAVALLRIRVGKEIGSAALVADGQHARTDGLTSLAVLVGAVGSLFGFPLADPLIGLLITVVILFILKDTAVTMWRRLMDAVDPALVDKIERVAAETPGVQDAHDVRVRWLGHRLHAELHVTVDEDLTTRESHAILEETRHRLYHAVPRLSVINVHADPCGHNGADPHDRTSHHAQPALDGQAEPAH